MREIKFRGKRVDNGKWVYGSLYSQYGTRHFIIVRNFDHPKDLCTSLSHIRGDFKEVIPETVGQYTGKHNNNGKEIYEGDIVKVFYECIDGEGYETGEVRYDLTKGGCFTYSNFFIFNLRVIKGGGHDIEVIGNIYDNPKLLEDSR